MFMQKLLANKTVSLTELRDPAKVLSKAGDSPVAVLNRNTVVGYFVPNAAVDKIEFETTSADEVRQALKDSKKSRQPVLDYLKDK